jgi:hypothetical protein
MQGRPLEPPLGIPTDVLRELLNRLEDSFKEIAPLWRVQSVAYDAVAEV